MWLLCSPASPNAADPGGVHLPSFISSTGILNQFRKARKPLAAGAATNCLSCPIEQNCEYSAKNIYVKQNFDHGTVDWPVNVVVPEIEDLYSENKANAKKRLLEVLAEDYTPATPNVEKRSWYGRCVWECDNDVCDDQVVTITWDDDHLPNPKLEKDPVGNGTHETNGEADGEAGGLTGRAAKTAIFHMIAPTEKICERRGRIYGTRGEITYDQDFISVYSFLTGKTTRYNPDAATGGHGGGDGALAENFCKAVQAVLEGTPVEEAQIAWLGCGIEEIVRSHVAVFAAEKARRERVVVDWQKFWAEEVEGRLTEQKREGD